MKCVLPLMLLGVPRLSLPGSWPIKNDAPLLQGLHKNVSPLSFPSLPAQHPGRHGGRSESSMLPASTPQTGKRSGNLGAARLESLGRGFRRRGRLNFPGRLPLGLLRLGWERLFELWRLLGDARRNGLRWDGLLVRVLLGRRLLGGVLSLRGLGFFGYSSFGYSFFGYSFLGNGLLGFRLWGLGFLGLGFLGLLWGLGGHAHWPRLDLLRRLQDIQTPVLDRGPVLPGPLLLHPFGEFQHLGDRLVPAGLVAAGLLQQAKQLDEDGFFDFRFQVRAGLEHLLQPLRQLLHDGRPGRILILIYLVILIYLLIHIFIDTLIDPLLVGLHEHLLWVRLPDTTLARIGSVPAGFAAFAVFPEFAVFLEFLGLKTAEKG